MTESELYHHGIKGQKWGVRRFQNEDGTLTSAGKKHLAEGKSGSFNSKGGTDLSQLGGSSGGGGGGGATLDEEDQKKLEEFWEDMAKLDGYEFPGQDESEFLAELGEAGIDTEKMSKEQVNALYKKASDTYNNARNGNEEQEEANRKNRNRPTSRKKYVTEATGTLKRRGSSGTGKVGHSYQAPSESELYHRYPFIQR